MVKLAGHVTIFRRRREGTTNYKRRKAAVISKQLMLYVFVSDKNTTIQIISPRLKGDLVLASTTSKELLKFGWKLPRRSVPAAYLTGLLLGSKAIQKNLGNTIVYTNVKMYHASGRVASALKGVLDAGFKLPVGEDTLPNDSRVSGAHIAAYATKLKEMNMEKYQRIFSGRLKAGIKPEEYPKYFEDIKVKILKEKVEK